MYGEAMAAVSILESHTNDAGGLRAHVWNHYIDSMYRQWQTALMSTPDGPVPKSHTTRRGPPEFKPLTLANGVHFVAPWHFAIFDTPHVRWRGFPA